MKWYKVDGLSDTDRPFIKKVTLGGRSVCLVGYNDQVFALGAKCPHAGEDLSRGWCADGKLVCPYHRFSYNLETGQGNPGQNDYVATYQVKIKEDGIYVGFETFAEKIKGMFR
jgi:nitrite reductase/ring-hydroxylating ferredoxin subunit